MKKIVVLLAGAAIAFTSSAAQARHYSNTIACSGYRDGQCTSWNRLTRKQEARVGVGTMFGSNYSYYTDFKTLPQAVVTQYGLSPDNRYVSADGYIYVVDPHTYAVSKVIAPAAPALPGDRQYSNTIACSGYRHGECTSWNRLTAKQENKIKVGTVFGSDYTYYSDFKTLPQPIVTQYSLSPDYRYVSVDGYIYVVDPHTYAVTRVIVPSR